MSTILDGMKWAAEINIKTTTNIDITPGSLPEQNNIEKHPNFKVGEIPAQYRRCVQQLLRVATARVLQDAIQCLKEGLCDRPYHFEIEISDQLHESASSLLENDKQEYICAFQYPLLNFHYIALTPYEFGAFVCSSNGLISDCYVLCTNCSQEQIGPFKLSPIQYFTERGAEAPKCLPCISSITPRNMWEQNHELNMDSITQCDDDFENDDEYG